MSIFSVGAAVIDVGAHVFKEQFVGPNGADTYLDRTGKLAARGAHMTVTGSVSKDGFRNIGRQIKMTKDEVTEATDKIKEELSKMGDGSTLSAEELAKATKSMDDELRKLQESVDKTSSTISDTTKKNIESIKAESDARKRATEEALKEYSSGGVGGGNKGGKASEDAGKHAGEGYKKGFEKAANLGKWSLIGAGVLGGLSIKAAADFEKQMTMIVTQAGGSVKEVAKLKKEVLGLAPTVGVGPTKLAEGLFHIESAGFRGSKAMEILGKSAELARVGNANMTDTTNALLAILRTAPKDIHGTTEAVGVMNQIVGEGNMHMTDLAGAMTTGIIPAAKAVGLGMRDVGAALDVMTIRGVPAEQAATRLRTTLSLMANPTTKAKDALAQIGLTSTALAKAFEKGGLPAGLELVQKGLDKAFPKGRKLDAEEQKKAIAEYQKQLESMGVSATTQGKDIEQFEKKLTESGSAAIEQSKVITEAFGGARSGTTFQILLQNSAELKTHFDNLNKQGAAKKFEDDWKLTEKTFSEKVAKMWAGIQVLAVKLGDLLIPVVEKVATIFISITEAIEHNKTVMIAFVTLLGTVVLGGITAFFIKIGMSVKNAITDFKELANWMSKGKLFGQENQANSDLIQSQLRAEADAAAADAAAMEELNAARERQLGLAERLGGQIGFGGQTLVPKEGGGYQSVSKAGMDITGSEQFMGKTVYRASGVSGALNEEQARALMEARGTKITGPFPNALMPGGQQYKENGRFMSADRANLLGLGGVRDSDGPGTIHNPLVTVQGAGDRFPMGGMAAAAGAATADEAASVASQNAQAAGRSLGGSPSEKSLSSGGVVEEAAGIKGTKGFMSSMGGKLMGGLGAAGLVYGLGEAAGGIVGGTAGKQVSQISQYAAGGALLGSTFGPEGTVAGGLAGALVGGLATFLNSKTQGEKLAHGLSKWVTAPVAEALGHGVDQANKEAEKETSKKEEENRERLAKEGHRPGARLGRGDGHGRDGALNAQQQREVREEKERRLQESGQEFGAKVIGRGQDQGKTANEKVAATVALIQRSINNKDMPEAAKQAAAETMIAMAKEMEAKGQMPKNAYESIVQAIGGEGSKLKTFAEKSGQESMAEMKEAMKGKEVLKTTQEFFSEMHNYFAGFEQLPKITAQNAFDVYNKAQEKLREAEKSGNAATRLAAKENYTILKEQEEEYYNSRIKKMDDRENELKKLGNKKTKEQTEELKLLMEVRNQVVNEKAELGTIGAAKAARELAELYAKELKDLGGTPAQQAAATQAITATSQVGKGGKTQLHATGGIPNPGGGVADNHILLDPHGNPVAALSGTEGIINTPQMGVVDQALGLAKSFGAVPYGSLNELWNSGMTHYASGGKIPGGSGSGYVNPFSQLKGYTFRQIDQGVDVGGVGPLLSVGDGRIFKVTNNDPRWEHGSFIGEELTSGPSKGKFVYYAEGITPSVREGQTVKAGQKIANVYSGGEFGWAYGKGTDLPLQEFMAGNAPGNGPTPAGRSFNSFLSGLPSGPMVAGEGGNGKPFVPLKEPKYHGPGGSVGAVAKAMIAKITRTANEHLKKIAGAGENMPAGSLPKGNKGEFAKAVAKETGLPTRFILAWMNQEQGATTVEGGNNWLNIETGEPGGGSGPYGASAKWVERHTPQQAGKIEAEWLHKNFPQLLRARSATEAVTILENSEYAQSHYNHQSPASFLSAAATGGLLSNFRGGGPLAHAAGPSISTSNTPGGGGGGAKKTNRTGHHKRNPSKVSEHKTHPGKTGSGSKKGTKGKAGSGSGSGSSSNPKAKVKKTKAGKAHSNRDPEKTFEGLPNIIVGNEEHLGEWSELAEKYQEEYTEASESYGREPAAPQTLVTLTEADLAVIDPKSYQNAKGEFIPGPTGYEPGDQIVNPNGMVVGRYFGPNNSIQGGEFIPGYETRKAQLEVLGGLTHNTLGQYEQIRDKDKEFVEGPGNVKGYEKGFDPTLIARDKDQIHRREVANVSRKKRREGMEKFKEANEKRIAKYKKQLEELNNSKLSAGVKTALTKKSVTERKGDISTYLSELNLQKTEETNLRKTAISPTEKKASEAREKGISTLIAVTKEQQSKENAIHADERASEAVKRAEEAQTKGILKDYIFNITELNKRDSKDISAALKAEKEAEKLNSNEAKQQGELEGDLSTHKSDLKGSKSSISSLLGVLAGFTKEEEEIAKAANIQVRPRNAQKKQEEEAALKAVQNVAELGAATDQLFSQFGSNTVSTANVGQGAAFGLPGTQYFGGWGGTGTTPGGGFAPATSATVPIPPVQHTFNQYNTYQEGPQNPHVHAQESALEFETRVG